MSKFETRFEDHDDAESIRVDACDFVERYAYDEVVDGDVHIAAGIDRQASWIRVRLRRVEAMDTFSTGLGRAARPARRSCFA